MRRKSADTQESPPMKIERESKAAKDSKSRLGPEKEVESDTQAQEQATETNASQEELEIQSSEGLPEQTEPKDSPSAES